MISTSHLRRTAALGAALLFGGSQVAAFGQNQTGICEPTKAKFLSAAMDTESQSISSTNWVNVKYGGLNFVQGGSLQSCVIVQFSGQLMAFGARTMNMRAFLDDTTAALPGEMRAAANDGASGFVRTVNFIFPSVAPGTHTIRLQARSLTGEAVVIYRHSTIIHHAP